MPRFDHDHRLDLEASLDFINTLEHSESGDTDDLGSVDAALAWLAAHGAMHEEAAHARTARGDGDRPLREIHAVRGALRELVDSVVAERPPSGAVLDVINRTLAAEPAAELVPSRDGVAVAHRHELDPIAEALSRVVRPVVDALAEGRPDRLRVCANDHCRWVFFDTSPTARRRWCDMSSCGNRAKAARHRARKRAAAGGPATG